MKQPRPEAKGFFEPNLRHMNQFQRAYPYLLENPQRPVSELPEESRAGIIFPQRRSNSHHLTSVIFIKHIKFPYTFKSYGI